MRVDAWSRLALTLIAGPLLLAAIARPARAQLPAQPPGLREAVDNARSMFSNLNYEEAVRATSVAISMLEPIADRDEAARQDLARMLEYRALSNFNLPGAASADAARADIKRLLVLEPSFKVSAAISPKIRSAIQEIVKVTVGSIALALEPADAAVAIDGRPLADAAGQVPIAVGAHTITAQRLGYRPYTQTVTVKPGAVEVVPVTLERTAAVIRLVTVPVEVTVSVDGVERGRTEAGPLTPAFDEFPGRLNLPASTFSTPLVLSDLPVGSHIVSFTKPCYRPGERTFTIDQPKDFLWDPFVLERAVASVYVDSPVAGTEVLLDGLSKGPTPISIDDVCEGRHVVELRSPHGRFLQEIQARAGDKLTVQGTPRPAFAVVGASGLAAAYRGPDLKASLAQALGAASSITLFVPARDQLQKALAAESLSEGWLSFDRYRQPIGATAAAIAAAVRREISERLGTGLRAQGVAEVTVAPDGVPGHVYLSLLANGSGEPDVVDVTLDDQVAVGRVISMFDQPVTLFRPTVGLFAADVSGVDGAVVIRVDAAGAAASAGIAPGDRVVGSGGQPVASAAALQTLLGRRKPGEKLTFDIVDRSGAKKPVQVAVMREPRLIAMKDRSLLFNKLVVELRAAVATAAVARPDEAPVARLNLAVALMRLGNWAQALPELEKVTLPPAPACPTAPSSICWGCATKASGGWPRPRRPGGRRRRRPRRC